MDHVAPICTNLHQSCTRMHQVGHQSAPSSIYSKLHQSGPRCINLHQITPCCTNLHQVVPKCTNPHQVAPNCTKVHQVAPICTKLYQIASNCTKLHHTAPIFTSPHQHKDWCSLVQIGGVCCRLLEIGATWLNKN